MDAETTTWLVEGRVVLRNPQQASEGSRRDFVEAIRSIQGEERPAEVGWAGDYMAFVSVTRSAKTPEGAAASLREMIKRAATGGARWRLTTGLEVEILAVLPAD